MESNGVINSLTDHADSLTSELTDSLVKILRTWCDNKIIVTNLPDTIADAKEQTRQEISLQIEALVRDLMLSNGKVDSQKDFIKSLEAKVENLTKRVMDLSPYPELQASSVSEIERLQKQKHELESTIKRLENEYWCLSQLNDGSMIEILGLKGKIGDFEKAIANEAVKAVAMEQSFLKEKSEKAAISEQLATITLAAAEKVETSVSLYTQTDNNLTDTYTQTDFLNIPFSLRSVVAKGKGKYERRPFGVTIARPEIEGCMNDALFSPNFMAINKSLHR